MFTASSGFLRPKFSSIALLCFSASALVAAPQLRLSNTTVGPVYVEIGGSAAAQRINAFNIGDGTLHLTVTSSASWLSGSVGAATTCTGGPTSACIPINVSMNTTGLALGTYSEALTVSDPNAVDAPQSIIVNVQINGAPGNVDLYVTPAGGPTPTASALVNTGSQVQSTVSTTDGGQWLAFTLAGGGSFTFYTPYQVKVTAQPGQAGDYSGTVALAGSPNAADNKTIAVGMHVTSLPILQITPVTYNLVQGQGAKNFNLSLANLGVGALTATGVTASGGSWLNASVSGPTALSVTVDPTSLTPGAYSGSLTVASNAANTVQPIPIRLNLVTASNPIIAVGGVVDNATFDPAKPVASGSIAAVFGSQFSSTGAAYASSLPLPTTLADVQVLVNGTPAPLIYVDANQADFQVPFGLTAGTMNVQVVRNGQAGNQVTTGVDAISPRLFALKNLPPAPDTSPYGIVINASDGTLALPSNLGVPAHPARRGDVVTIYALGLGPTSPSVSTGAPAPAAEPLARTANPVQVLFGGGFLGYSQVTPSYAGLAPSYVGLYQINVTIPLDAPTGNIPVQVNLPGHASNFVEMAISPN